jgi:osmotically-inducible protein OsmY
MKRFLSLVLVVPLLTSCVAAVVGATAAGAGHDRRSFGRVVNDNGIELGIYDNLNQDKELALKNNVEIVVYNGVVLMIGEVRTQELKARAEAKVREIEGVGRVVNEVRIEPNPGIVSATRDKWITGRAKVALLDIVDLPGFDPSRVNITTQNSVVYLMGLVSREEAQRVVDIVKDVGGVERVVKVFDYTD